MSEVINGYLLEDKLQNRDSGFSKWGFAEKNSKKYFIKEFLYPIYPLEKEIGMHLSESQIIKKKEECQKFEDRLFKVYDAINRCSDGNVVRIQEFFRCNSKYYIVTEKMETTSSIEEASKMNYKDKLLLCIIITHCIMSLHKVHFVHGDIKPNNILLITSAEILTAKLIDFDSGFFEESPPTIGEELNGDPIYFAPEALRFMAEEKVNLTCKMDVFALGILFHQLMTGKQPVFSEKYDYVAEAVLDNDALFFSNDLPQDFKDLLELMLCKDENKRISIWKTYNILVSIYHRPTISKLKIYHGGIGIKDFTENHTFN